MFGRRSSNGSVSFTYITKQVAEERLSQVVTSHVDAANKHYHQLLSFYINQAKIIFLDGLADKTRRIFKDCFVDKSTISNCTREKVTNVSNLP